MPPVLNAENLVKRYGERTVLQGVSLRINAGERVGLMGPSGSGKSTLLNLLGGIDRADSGTLEIDSNDLTALDPEGLANLRRRTVSSIFQFFHLLPTLSARENVAFPLELLKDSEAESRADALLRDVGIEHRAHALPEQLSGGELQRVAIARALAVRPRLLLADEPTGNLDRSTGEGILDLLASLTDTHQIALLLVTHSAAATRICHRVLHLEDGMLKA